MGFDEVRVIVMWWGPDQCEVWGPNQGVGEIGLAGGGLCLIA